MRTRVLALLIVPLSACFGSQTNVRAQADPNGPAAEDDFFEMSLEQLMDVEIVSTAALTPTSARMAPAAITTITQEDILASGARSLFELLDIYVPNLQWIRHHWEADHLGLRGIINDRDDKYLLLVNGRVMNERTHYGAMSERDLVLLRDIHHIDIVRGPGSGLYGPGAVSMVINIVTDNARTFQGTEVSTRVGAVEEFYSAEIKHGQTEPENDLGIFLYAGASKYVGADQDDAPQIFAFDFPSESAYSWWNPAWGVNTGPASLPADGTEAGEPLESPTINRDGETHRNIEPIKLHAQVTKGNWDFWARYTRGGKQFPWDVGVLARAEWGWADWAGTPVQMSSGYQQATGYAGYTKELDPDATLHFAFSYDMFDFERILHGGVNEAYREDEYHTKIVLNWNVTDRHKLAVGSEFSREEFGLNSPGFPDEPARSGLLGNPMPRWRTMMFSIFAEHQWAITDQWTTFLGARLDDHTFNDDMFSPRAALIYTPTAEDTWKLLWSRSVRANFAEELFAAHLAGVESSAPEKLDSAELRYERAHSPRLSLAASAFLHYNLELITHSGGRNVPVGTQRDWGLEFEAVYRTDRTCVIFSHGYTKLYDFDLLEGQSTLTTAEPYGYGDDLANWSNHITKIAARRRLDDQWSLDGSLRVYWGFPGREDFDDYHRATTTYPVVEPGWEKAYRANVYLNLGLQYVHSRHLTVRVDGYNLLGLFDEDLNKRNYYDGLGDYRSHAPAVALWLIYTF
jgi:iron complex outermembrane receptor protein